MTMTTIFDVQTRQTQKIKIEPTYWWFLAALKVVSFVVGMVFLTYSKRVA